MVQREIRGREKGLRYPLTFQPAFPLALYTSHQNEKSYEEKREEAQKIIKSPLAREGQDRGEDWTVFPEPRRLRPSGP
ncbi:MAG: hypothetical protein A2Y79_07190 [Deltaproteobacteria bacterium RBG_13_43_22]|nr:MAG: hypothetical protein A2Y79_07190 [Deltaproteobacteria bacterium RBG_13_43_22]